MVLPFSGGNISKEIPVPFDCFMCSITFMVNGE
jgi:hypothetical protein